MSGDSKEDVLSPGSIRYLTAPDVIAINQAIINIISPDEPVGLLSEHLLESALASPSQYRYWQQCNDIIMLTAVLTHSLAKAHAFLNANKRTAAMCAGIFLMMNGQELTAPDHELVDFIEGLVVGHYTREEFADWLAFWIRPFDAILLNEDCS